MRRPFRVREARTDEIAVPNVAEVHGLSAMVFVQIEL
jgi:hypothetical protein